MARPEIITLDVPTANGVGQFVDVFKFSGKTVQFKGTFSASLSLEGSLDGSNFLDLNISESSPVIVSIPETIKFLRVRVSSYSSGTPEALFSGFDERAV